MPHAASSDGLCATLARRKCRLGGKKLDEAWLESRPAKACDTVARFKNLCVGAADEGHITEIVESMPDRLQEVLDNKGGPTSY